MMSVTKSRLKMLAEVTAPKLQEAVEQGLLLLQHRSLERLVQGLENMSWTTAISNHVSQIVAMECLLVCLLTVCSNGLVPQKLLEIALVAAHSHKQFEMSKPENAVGPKLQEACLAYLGLRLRMIAGKLRDLSKSEKARAQAFKKISLQQKNSLLKLCRILEPNVDQKHSSQDDTQESQESSLVPIPLQNPDTDHAIEQQWRDIMLVTPTKNILVTPKKENATSAINSSQSIGAQDNFLQRATKRALEAAFEETPAKPLTKKQRQAEQTAVCKKPAAQVLKKPSCKNANSDHTSAPADCKKKEKLPQPTKPAAELLADGFPLQRWGCSKCRSSRIGCGRCRDFAARHYKNYFVTLEGWIAQKKVD